MSNRRKLFFELTPDESGYPPVATESLWGVATEVPTEYVVDNIPFFERAATLGDTVRVEEVSGCLWYRTTMKISDHSLIRVVGLDGRDPTAVGRELEGLGCSWEGDANHNLIALDVPPNALARATVLIAARAEAGVIGYEEPILR